MLFGLFYIYITDIFKFLETNTHFTFQMDSGVYDSTVHDGYSGFN